LLHLGHLVNALFVWGIARATGGRVILRVEDHDRQRSRRTYETALLDDLERLGLLPDEPSLAELRAGPSPYRQSDDPAPYAAAVATLGTQGRVYACACARAALLTWHGPGCPGGCRERALPEDTGGSALRAWLGEGDEPFDDVLLGARVDDPSAGGDLTLRDRHGNWSYPLCVVVDDVRHGVDLVIRGRDLLEATPGQLRLGRLLGRETPPAFLHHPLLRKPSGAKLSKADHDTAIRELLAGGATPDELLGFVAAAIGLLPVVHPIPAAGIADLFATPAAQARYAPAGHGEITRSGLPTRQRGR
jgi:glutamyl-tRNA synthetase/glutamyl-Q tRNA(Asp) synthetase